MSTIIKSREDELLELQGITTEIQTLNTNGAKEAKQDTMITTLGTIDTAIDSSVTELQTLNTNGAKESKQDDIITAINGISGGGGGTIGTASSVAASATSITLLASNADRKELIIRNDGNSELYIAYGATATLTSAIKLDKGDTLTDTVYTGQITGIWSSANGNARIIEVD